MTKLITDVDMPQTKSHLFPSKLTKYEQIEKNFQISKSSWIARFEYGYIIYYQDDIKKILTDKRWHNAMAFYAGINDPNDNEESEYYSKRRANVLINMEGEPVYGSNLDVIESALLIAIFALGICNCFPPAMACIAPRAYEEPVPMA